MAKGLYDAGRTGIEIKEFMLWAYRNMDENKKYDNWETINQLKLYLFAWNIPEREGQNILSGCYWAFDSFSEADAGKLYNCFVMINHLWQFAAYREGD